MKKIIITERQAALIKLLKAGKKLKVTKEQYDRLIAPTLTESDMVKGGINRVDKSFKKTFAGANVQNLDEDQFDIKQPNTDLPTGQFNKPIHEGIVDPAIEAAVETMIKAMYLEPDNICQDEFFKSKGITWEELEPFLTEQGLIQAGPSRTFHIAKRSKTTPFTSGKQAIEAIENAVSQFIAQKGGGVDAAPAQAEPVMQEEPISLEKQEFEPTMEPNPETIPVPAEDPSLGILGQEPVGELPAENPTMGKPKMKIKIVATNPEIAILSNDMGELYIFDFESIHLDAMGEITDELIAHYINNNQDQLGSGEGIEAFNSGVSMVKIDDALKAELLSLYDKDPLIVKALNTSLNEMTGTGSAGAFSAPLAMEPIKKSTNLTVTPTVKEMREALPNLIKEFSFRQSHALHSKYDPNYDGKFDVEKLKEALDIQKEEEVEPIEEVTSTAPAAGGGGNSVGQYDVNAFPDMGPNGEFKKKKQKMFEDIAGKTGRSLQEVETLVRLHEMGMNDRQVKAIVSHLQSADPAEYARCFMAITHKDISRVKNPNAFLQSEMAEMGKEDMNAAYAAIFPQAAQQSTEFSF